MTTAVVRALGALAHDAVHPSADAGGPCACPAPAVLADRADGTVVRSGPVVAKAHAPGTDTAALTARLALASSAALAGVLLPPVSRPSGPATPTVTVHGRTVTLWPHGDPVDPADPDAAPWEEAAGLLARLHRTSPVAASTPTGPPVPALPTMRGPAKAARAVARMHAARPDDPATAPVREAWRRLPAWARDEAATPPHRSRFLCHGDLHLGQLVRHPAPHGPWLLIDVDDLGLGDPAWDLARPAAWYAAGLLPPEVWLRFLDAYRAAGGPAIRAEGDPWPELDVPARALTVQTAALAFVKSAAQRRTPDEVEQTMIDACARIASLPPELTAEHSS
ncbi:phosphotransferase family protein [Streptomyces sp. NBC_00316]|uniref:phosphotransferase family protein n=1 Tax=Streptomyces sp. NBC_00316 TaxID=2975710 RepID=UPI002E28AD2C|nr:aminoglycoside phosphotransferase family protein [Streptomyces sp. NBC_00316]